MLKVTILSSSCRPTYSTSAMSFLLCRFSGSWWDITLPPSSHVDCPEVSWLTNVEETGKIDWYGVKRATDWHTDSTFEDTLPLLAMLHAKEVPSEKGGTMFADMRAAYDALPEARKQRLSGLTGLHGRTSGPGG